MSKSKVINTKPLTRSNNNENQINMSSVISNRVNALSEYQ